MKDLKSEVRSSDLRKTDPRPIYQSPELLDLSQQPEGARGLCTFGSANVDGCDVGIAGGPV